MARGISLAQLDSQPQKESKLAFASWIQVDLSALEHNLKVIEQHSQAPILPIVKGNAYGHGAPVIASFLQSRGHKLVGVSSIEEALEILKLTKIRLLILTPPLQKQLPLIFKHNLITTVTDPEQAVSLAQLAKHHRRLATIHIKVDTGFGRLGVAPNEFLALVELIKKSPYLKLEGVFTHFSVAAADRKFTQKQLEKLLFLKKQLEIHYPSSDLTWHAANSAAFLTLPESHLDMVRVGTLLYGQSPLPLGPQWNLADTWQFKTTIIQIRTLPRGHGVGYGRAYRAKKPTRVGVIPVGYGHGLELEPQSSTGRQLKQLLAKTFKAESVVFFQDSPLPLLGRVSMGLSCVDLSKKPHLKVGDEVQVVMRRVTASQHVPRYYYLNNDLKCIYWNGQILNSKLQRTSLKRLF